MEVSQSKLRMFRLAKERFRQLRKENLLKKARSLKQFIMYIAHIKCGDILEEFEIWGTKGIEYYAFVRSCVKDFFRWIFESTYGFTDEEIMAGIDKIFEYYAFWYLMKWQLNKDILAQLEVMLVDLFLNMDKHLTDYKWLELLREEE